jgi:hypothetical protein
MSIAMDVDRDGSRSIAIESVDRIHVMSVARRGPRVVRRHIPARTHRETREVLHLAHGTVRASSSQSFVFKPLCDHLPCVTRDRSLSRAPHAFIRQAHSFARADSWTFDRPSIVACCVRQREWTTTPTRDADV